MFLRGGLDTANQVDLVEETGASAQERACIVLAHRSIETRVVAENRRNSHLHHISIQIDIQSERELLDYASNVDGGHLFKIRSGIVSPLISRSLDGSREESIARSRIGAWQQTLLWLFIAGILAAAIGFSWNPTPLAQAIAVIFIVCALVHAVFA